MPRRDINPDLYAALLVAFREKPGNYAYAAAATVKALGPERGCERRMAKMGWLKGWAPRISWARCIRIVLEEEQAEARARQLREEQAARRAQDSVRVDARNKAIEVTKAEAMAVSFARGNILAILGSVGLLAGALRKQAEKLAKQIEAGTVSPKDLGFLFKNLSSAVSASTMALERVVDLEREVVGDPKKLAEELAGVTTALEEAGDFDPMKAADEVRRLNGALERAQRLGLFALDGGKGQAPSASDGPPEAPPKAAAS